MPPLTLTILDPTSLLGRDAAETCALAFPGIRRRYFHTTGDAEHVVTEVAGEAALVPPLNDPDELEGSRAVVVTTAPPPMVAARLLDWLRGNREVALVDVTQPGLAPDECEPVLGPPARIPNPPWYHLADPALAGPARVLAALGPLGVEGIDATLLRPASVFGGTALDELAAQAAARLSGGSPKKPKALPGVLAFDLRPAAADAQAAIERQAAVLLPGSDCRISLVDAGVFHGNVAVLSVRFSRPVREERVREALRGAEQVRVARRNERVGASDVVGQSDVVCGELRVQDQRVSVWVAADGLLVGVVRALADLLGALTAS